MPTEYLDFTDMPPINIGSGGLGLGTPWQPEPLPSLADTPSWAKGEAVPTSSNPLKITVTPNAQKTDGEQSWFDKLNPFNPNNPGYGVNPMTGEKDQSTGFLGPAVVDWLLRGVIIVLGFIFVAVGLGMFKGERIIQVVKKADLT